MAAPVATRRMLLVGVGAMLLPRAAWAQGLYEQALAHELGAPVAGLEYLLFDLRTHAFLVDRFADSRRLIPVGSLLKPFLAVAYARSHATFPMVTCRGRVDQCWSGQGHGMLSLPLAIAHSCNAYFLALARDLEPGDIPYLPPPPKGAGAETLIGLTPAWSIAPERLVRAYAGLLTDAPNAAVAGLHEGMRLSAMHGTAAGLGVHRGGVLAKTGTAPCVDSPCRVTGDGLVIAAVPAEKPRLLLLVRRRATTGAVASAAAGEMLSRLEAMHAY